MRVVIVGAGDVGRRLAIRLSDRHQVLLLDVREDCHADLGARIEPTAVAAAGTSHGVICVHGDGTSRLVLDKLFDSELSCALITVTGNDEGNLEAGRIARAVGFQPIIAIQHDSANIDRYREAHITALDRPMLLADEVERSLRHKGAIVPTGIGLGKGELVEIRLQQTSPVLGRPLSRLAPFRWRVAAIFRGAELIVPTGETVLEEDDRVLLVGDPKILPTVIEYLRLGTPQFPRPFGPNVVTVELDGPDTALVAEAESLACASGAAHLVRGAPGVEDHLPDEEVEDPLTHPICKGRVKRRSFALPRQGDRRALGQRIREQRPGVVVVRPQRRRLAAKLLGLSRPDADLCDTVSAPVLFAHGSFPYRRILLPVSESDVNISGAEVAIDLTRQLGASLTAMNVDLPQYISGTPEEMLHDEVVPIRRLCQLYEVPLDYRHRHGNPIEELIMEAAHHDLVVMARRRHRRDSYFDPDVALRLARAAPCSVIILSVRDGE